MTESTEIGSSCLGRLLRVAVLVTLLLCIGLGSSVAWLMHYGYQKGPRVDAENVIVDIPKGTSVRGIGRLLGGAGIITDDIRFLMLARWQGVSAKLRAGEFMLPTGKTPVEILDLLVKATPYQHVVTLPEGLRADEIAEIFARDNWCEAESFREGVIDQEFIEDLGFSGISSLEGYLYPDTYYLTRDMQGCKKVISLLVNRFNEVWQEVTAGMEPPPDQQKTVILASIVEKETGDAEERPVIASVFHNRLQKGMKLQSDPTVVYGVADYDGKITITHLKTETPYNTYVIPGLPAGPIANPGKAALEAVLQPAQAEYLYFVSKNDGTHQFSTNLKDHNRAVRKYQRKKTDKDSKE